MRRTPEAQLQALIARLRNRKGRIIAYTISVLLLVGLVGTQWFVYVRMNSSLVPKEGDDLLLHVVTGQSVVGAMAGLFTIMVVLGVCCTTLVVKLIAELVGATREDLLVHLWERLRALEQTQLPPGQQTQCRGAQNQSPPEG